MIPDETAAQAIENRILYWHSLTEAEKTSGRRVATWKVFFLCGCQAFGGGRRVLNVHFVQTFFRMCLRHIVRARKMGSRTSPTNQKDILQMKLPGHSIRWYDDWGERIPDSALDELVKFS